MLTFACAVSGCAGPEDGVIKPDHRYCPLRLILARCHSLLLRHSLALSRSLVSGFDRIIEQVYPFDFQQYPAAYFQIR